MLSAEAGITFLPAGRAINEHYTTVNVPSKQDVPNAGLLLGHRLRRWPNSKPSFRQRLLLNGQDVVFLTHFVLIKR